MFTPKKLNIDNLKVGDIVAVKYSVTYGWYSFLCESYQVLTISKITPKQTKVSFEGTHLEVNPMRESLYEVTDDLLEYVTLTKKYGKLAEYMYAFAEGLNINICKIRPFIVSLPVEQLDDYISNFEKSYTIMRLCEEHSKV